MSKHSRPRSNSPSPSTSYPWRSREISNLFGPPSSTDPYPSLTSDLLKFSMWVAPTSTEVGLRKMLKGKFVEVIERQIKGSSVTEVREENCGCRCLGGRCHGRRRRSSRHRWPPQLLTQYVSLRSRFSPPRFSPPCFSPPRSVRKPRQTRRNLGLRPRSNRDSLLLLRLSYQLLFPFQFSRPPFD